MSTRPAPPPAAPADLARFAGAVSALQGEPPLALAVSGGGDSLALLRLAAAAFPTGCTALSVDHGLRAEAAAECALAARHAAELGVPHVTLKLHALPPGPGVQARARAGRYAAMAGWCRSHGVPFLLTAHHADDQAETLLLRLRRGGGVGGLAGVRPKVRMAGVTVLRPLLGWRRAELRALLPPHWQVVDDPSNRDPRHDRTLARALLAREPWLDPAGLAASAAHLADAEAALQWATERAAATRITTAGERLLLDVDALPFELRRRLLAAAIARFGAAADGGDVARLTLRLEAGGGGTLAGIAARSIAAGWEIRAAPPRRKDPAGG